jgi:metal transporter CNNM
MNILVWFGIMICLVHSALFSGLNLGFFGISRLKLEIEAELGNGDALRILQLRKDSHFLLTTVLWGNVMSNVLLALLSESILAGAGAFIFSTFFITITAEILPQAYFTRHILNMSAVLVPVIRIYQVILYPIAKPTALILDKWLGRETSVFFSEEAIKVLLKKHALGGKSQISRLESVGAINFLNLDDIKAGEAGSRIDPQSVIVLPVDEEGLPLLPDFESTPNDSFIQILFFSGKQWVIITNLSRQPILVMNVASLIKDMFFKKNKINMIEYCYRPIIVTDHGATLGQIIKDFKVTFDREQVKSCNLVLFWTKEEKRIITGTDLLKRLLKGTAV